VKKSGLANMTIDALITLRDNADRIIRTRAKSERRALEKQLSRLSSYIGINTERATGKHKSSSLKGRKVAPKYRNPANKSETWAGRGVRPRWLRAALKGGHKIEEFAIKKPGSQQAAKKRTRSRAKPKPGSQQAAKKRARSRAKKAALRTSRQRAPVHVTPDSPPTSRPA
jgi:DNA-binding protein H-NS